MSAVAAIQSEIARREGELEALRNALAALTGSAPTTGRKAGGAGSRRPKTDAEKKAIGEAIREAWRRRKAAAKKAVKAEAAATPAKKSKKVAAKKAMKKPAGKASKISKKAAKRNDKSPATATAAPSA